MPTRRFPAALALIILIVLTAPLRAQAPAASAGYQVPPKVIVDILDAAPRPMKHAPPRARTMTASVAVGSPR